MPIGRWDHKRRGTLAQSRWKRPPTLTAAASRGWWPSTGAQHVRALGKAGAIVGFVGKNARQDQHHLINSANAASASAKCARVGGLKLPGRIPKRSGFARRQAQELH